MLNDAQFVAVDVSKAMVEIAFPDQIWRTPNTLSGITALQKRLKRFEYPHVVCEATGRYGRLLARQLGEAGIALSVINPRQVRDFARAASQLAKTDSINAAIILRFAETMKPAQTPPTLGKPSALGGTGAQAAAVGRDAGDGKTTLRRP